MKPFITLVTVAALMLGGVVYANNGVDLNQSPEVTATQQGTIHQPKEQSRKPLNYVNQPPVIPHSRGGLPGDEEREPLPAVSRHPELSGPPARRASVRRTLPTATAW